MTEPYSEDEIYDALVARVEALEAALREILSELDEQRWANETDDDSTAIKHARKVLEGKP